MKFGFISTFFNEEDTIKDFIHSLFVQSKLPDEIVLVDGGSTDKTMDILQGAIIEFKKYNKRVTVKVFTKKGNRAIGRNFAIENCACDVIACSDAGCVLDRKWFENIIAPFHSKSIDVVAGFYKGLPTSTFELSLIPYVLVMSDKVDPHTFLPATRSMAFKKSIWEKVGKFDERLSNNEDYVFAKMLKKYNAHIEFSRNAIAGWIPRKNVPDSFTMFYRFARGDAEARIYRPKVVLIFARYIGIFLLLDLYVTFHKFLFIELIMLLVLMYISWAIWKNYRYVKKITALYYLPLLQFISDIAVMMGTILGTIIK